MCGMCYRTLSQQAVLERIRENQAGQGGSCRLGRWLGVVSVSCKRMWFFTLFFWPGICPSGRKVACTVWDGVGCVPVQV